MSQLSIEMRLRHGTDRFRTLHCSGYLPLLDSFMHGVSNSCHVVNPGGLRLEAIEDFPNS